MSSNKIQFGRPKKHKQKLSELTLTIDNLSLEGRGVSKQIATKKGQKAIFVDGAIPGEIVRVKISQQHKNYDEAKLVSIEQPSVHRVDANCEHYNHCGGCQLQHIETTAQLDFKQQAVLSLLARSAKVIPVSIQEPIRSAPYHYRRTARIGVNRLSQSNNMIVGFRRKGSSKLLQVAKCNILPENLSGLFDQLRQTLQQISNAKAITHIEYQQGDQSGALTFRCKEPLSKHARDLLATMLTELGLQGFLKFDLAIEPLQTNADNLSYFVNQVELRFNSGDFLQVNSQVNKQMINRAIEWLALTEKDHVLDLFSGLGNFSLPIAKHVATVTGVEGSESMVQRASENALYNKIENSEFFSANLAQSVIHHPWYAKAFNKIILDPPRSGASELISSLLSGDQEQAKLSPELILYIACDPSSLARDTALLASLGYQLTKFCVMDMFPNTTHIETMALFSKGKSNEIKINGATKTKPKKKKLFSL